MTVDPDRERNHLAAAKHVFERPLPEVWTHVRALLDDAGYSYMEEPGTFTLVTEFQEQLDGADAVSIWRRYLVKGHAIDAEHTVVRFYRHELAAYAEMVDNKHGHLLVFSKQAQRGDFNPRHNGAIRYRGRNQPSLKRDLAMEWELVRRVEWLPVSGSGRR